jgi:pumilio RNA-binding family
LKGKWASLACHETGSLVVQVRSFEFHTRFMIDILGLQHAFENLEESAKDGIVDELLNQGSNIFSEVAKSQWGSYCIQHSEWAIFQIK